MEVVIMNERQDGLSNNCRSSTVAKLRWKMLAKALHEGRVHQSSLCPGSTRQFTTFGLIRMLPLCSDEFDDPKGQWFQCTCPEEPRFELKIRILSDKVTFEELKGFDNTGNVCIWPSEEVLTYYCMKNKELFGGKSVCELGGGMAALSGLAVAATAGAKEVFVTDGNLRSVQNVQIIIEQNIEYFGATQVFSRLLRWDVDEDLTEARTRFDIVLCADCLYYDEGRQPLSHTIWKILKDSGLAVLLAPTRGQTFQQFVEIVQDKFHVERLVAYDTHVWDLHCQLKEVKGGVYDEDLHYPQMLILRKM